MELAESFPPTPAAPRRILWDAAEEVEELDEPDLLGPVQRPDRSWGSLAAGALMLVALLGVFLWYQRPSAGSSSMSTAPAFAPPTVAGTPDDDTVVAVPLIEADPIPPAEPEIFEELPVEPEPVAAEPEITEPEPIAPPAPPAPIAEPVQIVQEVRPQPAPRKVAPPKPQAPKIRSQEPPVEIAEAPRSPKPEPPAPKRAVAAGPPAERMAGVLRPGPGVEMPVPLDIASARFPAAARGRGLRERVHLDVLVDENGKAIEAVVREGESSGLGFNEAAITAALATRFQPAMRWDLPGKAWTELIFEFEEPVERSR